MGGPHVVKRAGAPASRGGAAAFRRSAEDAVPSSVAVIPFGSVAGVPAKPRDSDHLFRALFDQAADAIILVDPQGRIVLANARSVEITGYDPDEILGLPLLETYVPGEREIGRRRMQPGGSADAAGGALLRFERLLLRKDGSILAIDVSTSWLPNGERLSIFRDISDRKAIEEARQLDDARLEALLDLSKLECGSVQALLDAVLERMVALASSRYGYIYFYDETSETLTLHAWSKGVMPDCSIPDPRRISALSEIGLWGEPIRQRRPVVLNDFVGPNPLKRGLPAGHARLLRFMTVPVFGRGKIVALAGVANKLTDYTDGDVAQLTQFMDGAWRIAERQKAEDELRVLAQELEARVASRTRELAAANDELESVNLELSAANETLHTILGERETLEAELAYRALHDPLTGLANRTMFQERLDYAFRISQPWGGGRVDRSRPVQGSQRHIRPRSWR